jgi:hypothetical protein
MGEGADPKPQREEPEPIVRTATQARQGEIILGNGAAGSGSAASS